MEITIQISVFTELDEHFIDRCKAPSGKRPLAGHFEESSGWKNLCSERSHVIDMTTSFECHQGLQTKDRSMPSGNRCMILFANYLYICINNIKYFA